MLPVEFILTDAHFAIGMMAGLACFAAFWLYLDAWMGQRAVKDLFKWLGFLILALGFVVTATEVDPAFLGQTWFSHIGTLAAGLRLIGYVVLAIGLGLDPLQPVPQTKGVVPPEKKLLFDVAPEPGLTVQPAAVVAQTAPVPVAKAEPVPVLAPEPSLEAEPKKPAQLPAVVAMGLVGLRIALPIAAGAVAYLYWRRATTGLERHLKPVALAFAWFTLFEVFELGVLGRGSTDPRIYDLTASFGPLWLVSLVLLAVAAVFLGRWSWRYLTKRLQTQLFMVLTMACLVIFLVTTVSFTFLLMKNVQDQAFSSLGTTARVLDTTIAGQRAAVAADADVVAQNSEVIAAVTARDHARLTQLTTDFLTTKKRSSLMITTESAQVLLRAEDPANRGDSVSSDTLVARAAIGKGTSGLVAASGALSPRLIMKATTPVRNASGIIIGTVTVGSVLDNGFVDGLKQTTGLAASIYGGSTRVATTLAAADGKSRLVGVTETNKTVKSTVLERNQTWSGLLKVDGRSYLAVYAPLRDVDNAPVGMLFIGQPQALLLQAAGRSIELTFVIAVLLLVVAIVPVHYISRSIARQLH